MWKGGAQHRIAIYELDILVFNGERPARIQL
jgi:hypothetical protein